MTRVFVYGTLKKGYGNSHLLRNAEFVGHGYTIETYRMFNVGFPIIRECEDGNPVYGEVYEVDDQTLKNLDRLENEGVMYDRKVVNVGLPCGKDTPIIEHGVSIYVGNPEYWDKHTPAPYTHHNTYGELEWHP
jgi:gamma-glutamylcyclotransferase (GGCT)/AIG2-like uncharacterized protein YtfP